MKYAMILAGGAADEPVEALDGRTPLEAAVKPNIDWISMNGRQGCVATVPHGFAPGSDVALLSLFGYDPHRYYSGRGALEAVAHGLGIASDQLVFRCNFVTLVDGRMEDFTAGHIRQIEADRLIADLNEHFRQERCVFHSGVSYRNLMVASDAADFRMTCTPPHSIPGAPASKHLPKGRGADWIRSVMDRARSVLVDHDVNLVRRDLRENPATDIWPWGQGRPTTFEPFVSRHGLTGALVGAVDLIRGIGRCAGMTLIDVPGVTGRLDTDYQAKGRAAMDALDAFDFVVVHIEAPDEAGHQGDAEAKIEAIERIDEAIVGPVLAKLREFDQWRVLIALDHATPIGRRVHTAAAPPFCLAGSAVHTVLNRPFSETTARTSDLQIDPGYDLMEYFLRA